MGNSNSIRLNEEAEADEACCGRQHENPRKGHMDCRTNFAMAPRPTIIQKCGKSEDRYSPSESGVQQCKPFARPELRPKSTRVSNSCQ